MSKIIYPTIENPKTADELNQLIKTCVCTQEEVKKESEMDLFYMEDADMQSAEHLFGVINEFLNDSDKCYKYWNHQMQHFGKFEREITTQFFVPKYVAETFLNFTDDLIDENSRRYRFRFIDGDSEIDTEFYKISITETANKPAKFKFSKVDLYEEIWTIKESKEYFCDFNDYASIDQSFLADGKIKDKVQKRIYINYKGVIFRIAIPIKSEDGTLAIDKKTNMVRLWVEIEQNNKEERFTENAWEIIKEFFSK